MTTPSASPSPTDTSPTTPQRIDDEPLRLVTSYNDIFVVIAAGLLIFGTVWFSATASLPEWLSALIVIATAWGLSEIFVRRRRMALPALCFAHLFVSSLFYLNVDGTDSLPAESSVSWWTLIATCLCAGFGAAIYWWRFRVPAVITMGIAGVVLAVWMHVSTLVNGATPWLLASTVVAGLAIFVWALRWDSQDLQRASIRSDIAFWLHLLAACMIAHPIFWVLSPDHPVAVIAVFLLLTAVSIAIDRRALIVSSLIYVLISLNVAQVEASLAIVSIVVGSTLLVLSIFWRAARRAVLRCLPAGWQTRLPR
jgi:hypothetical protein